MTRNTKTSRLLQILRHSFATLFSRAAPQVLKPEHQRQLALCIAQAEQGHRGEIRLIVEATLPSLQIWQGRTARQRAIQWFSDLRVWDTECNSGIVLYLLLADHKIEIVADRGIAAQVPQASWNQICKNLQDQINQAQLLEGLEQALCALGDLLRMHFPLQQDEINPDELSNDVVFRN